MDKQTEPTPDYKALYMDMFNDVSDAIGFFNTIETVAGNARRRLMKAQQDAEEKATVE